MLFMIRTDPAGSAQTFDVLGVVWLNARLPFPPTKFCIILNIAFHGFTVLQCYAKVFAEIVGN